MAPALDQSSPPTNIQLFTCADIARDIAKTRGHCHRSSVWRAIQRLKIRPFMCARSISFYTPKDKRRVAAALRQANATR